MRKRPACLVLLIVLSLSGCAGIPSNVTAVDGFDINRYLGTWYEIARLDHPFERGLSHITATYQSRNDGGITVINRGWDKASGTWKQAKGKAYFVSRADMGRLKVSFFGPFYAGYNIIALDKETYSYALVCGPKRSYLWILSRTDRLDDETMTRLINYARRLGFDVDELIFVDHTRG